MLVEPPATVNATVGSLLLLSAAGSVVIVTTGAAVSIVKLAVVSESALPAPSETSTVIVCAPSATFENVGGDVQATGVLASSWQRMVVAPTAVNATVGSLLL